MMAYTYSVYFGKERVFDIECWVRATVINDGGEPTLDVTELNIDGSDVNVLELPEQTDGYKLGQIILDDIFNNSAFIDEAAFDAGWRYETRGGNDPEARWVQP
jgi:hypothetical protein